MKNLLLIFLMFCTSVIYSQKLKNHIFQDENSATTEKKNTTANKNIEKAYFAYAEDDLEKAKYFIDQSQRQGIKTGDFYFLLGAYMYRTKEFKAAKRYWNISHKEGGCWECKTLIEKLESNESLEDIILEKVNEYLKSK